MRSCIDRLLELRGLESDVIQAVSDRLVGSLEVLRAKEEISNDAFLAAGVVQGGLAVVADLVNLEVDEEEVRDRLKQLLTRAIKLEDQYPGLNEAIENAGADCN